MAYNHWIRDASKVHSDLMKQPNGSVVTRQGCVIHIPERFLEKNLVELGEIVSMVGIYAICVADKHYGVSTLNATLKIKPSRIQTVKIEDVSYLEFRFDPGSVVFIENLIVRTDLLVYRIFDEIIAKGKVPWYLDYEDLVKLFETSDEYAGVNLSSRHAILEMIAAAISRDSSDRTVFYRQRLKQQSDIYSNPPDIVPLKSVTYGASNTTAKLMGAYWNDGMTSALATPSDKVEHIEELLRL